MKVLIVLALIALSQAEEFNSTSFDLEVIPERPPVTTRIVNGKTAAQNQFPHQALVYIGTLQGTFQCGGSLINSLWVLCAAHCVTFFTL